MTFVDDHMMPLNFAENTDFPDDVFVSRQKDLEVNPLDSVGEKLSALFVSLEDKCSNRRCPFREFRRPVGQSRQRDQN